MIEIPQIPLPSNVVGVNRSQLLELLGIEDRTLRRYQQIIGTLKSHKLIPSEFWEYRPNSKAFTYNSVVSIWCFYHLNKLFKSDYQAVKLLPGELKKWQEKDSEMQSKN